MTRFQKKLLYHMGNDEVAVLQLIERFPARFKWWTLFSDLFGRPSVASVYVALYQLENKGVIESRWDPRMTPELLTARGGRRRRLYRRSRDFLQAA